MSCASYGRPAAPPAILALLAALIVVSACGRADPPRRVPQPGGAPRPAAAPQAPSQEAEACYAALRKLPVSFRTLPPRRTAEGCGFDDGVQLLDIGVPVPGLTAISCPAAIALYGWITDEVQPLARKHFGERVDRIQSYGTYSCRSVNSRPGAKLSEHAHANAVDIAAFRLESGRTVRVESGWRAGGADSAFLKDVHQAGCRKFQIVIGPDGDRYHQDHLHMDMGRGPYCR
ncbi:extensin family protein [Pacificimonas flava]|uniref:Extensin-like C-terminal domain-containing protein n=1 Tax=Pacificimonas flava TaxID=1234595 RepID=M2U594_9SPHN|nr:extensin family protein [Pacificimonas flava]EMD83202.1 hypothetical protein C725_1103 [Pacificimonas flava]MBB5279233.1 hypothetical protein [Pacificimonas flava]